MATLGPLRGGSLLVIGASGADRNGEDRRQDGERRRSGWWRGQLVAMTARTAALITAGAQPEIAASLADEGWKGMAARTAAPYGGEDCSRDGGGLLLEMAARTAVRDSGEVCCRDGGADCCSRFGLCWPLRGMVSGTFALG